MAMSLPPEAAPSAADTSGRVIRGSVTYAAAAVLQRGVPLLLLPLFAHVLTPSEFGQIGVIIALAAALATLLSFGLETAIFRGYREAVGDSGAMRSLINTVGGFALLVPIAGAAAIAALAAPTLAAILDVPPGALVLGCTAAGLTAATTLVPLALMRAQERLRDYLQLTSIQVATTAGLTILFVPVLGWGVSGWMLASVLSSLLFLVRGLAILGHRWAFDIDLERLRRALRFGLPLVPHAFAHWGLAVSDRAIIVASVGSMQAGPYYAAYQLTLPVTLVSIALAQGSQPVFADASHSNRPQEEITRIATSQAVLVMLAASLVALVVPSATLLLLPDAYATAAAYIPWLALGACFFGLYLMPMNAIALTAGRTGRVWTITAAAATANVVLNLALVPRIGAYAAAVNTAIGYAILVAGVWAYMHRVCHPPIRYELRPIAVAVLLIGAAFIAATWLSPSDPIFEFVARVVIAVALVASLVALGPLSREARSALRAIRPAPDGMAP
jgi:O-antigen/teichoic acid export membrane protein